MSKHGKMQTKHQDFHAKGMMISFLNMFIRYFHEFFFAFFRNIAEAMRTFSDYTGRKLYSVDKDTTQLLT